MDILTKPYKSIRWLADHSNKQTIYFSRLLCS